MGQSLWLWTNVHAYMAVRDAYGVVVGVNPTGPAYSKIYA